MRDHRPLHTPQKDHHQIVNRRTKLSSEIPTKPTSRKCLNSVFSPGSEIAASESSKDATDISSITEVCDDNQLYESMENLVTSPSPSVSSAVASAVYDLSPLSSVITSDLSPFSSMITSTPSRLTSTITCDELECGTAKSSVAVKRGIMVKLAAKGFKQAGTKASNSNDMILLSKNVCDGLLRIRIEELYDFFDEGSWLTETIQKRVFFVLRKVFGIFLSVVLLIVICVEFCYFSSQICILEPPPT